MTRPGSRSTAKAGIQLCGSRGGRLNQPENEEINKDNNHDDVSNKDDGDEYDHDNDDENGKKFNTHPLAATDVVFDKPFWETPLQV